MDSFVTRLRVVGLVLMSLIARGQGTWENAPIGCSGRSFGVQQSAASGKIFIRTDVGGLYVQTDPATNVWRSLAIPAFGPDYNASIGGCLGLGIHPTNDNILYAAFSNGIFRSADGGATWVLKRSVRTYPNGSPTFKNDRQYGESIMVDRYNPNIVYFASQDKGIFYTRDGSATWTNTATTLQTSPALVVDNVREKVDIGTATARARFIYVGVKKNGLYRSTDGGTSFSKWTTGLAVLDTGTVKWLRMATNGDLYAANGSRLVRWDGTAWQDRTPSASVGADVSAVATDPVNPDRLLCGIGGQLYRSFNRGETWEELADSRFTLNDRPAWTVVGNSSLSLTGTSVLFSVALDRDGNAYASCNYFSWVIRDIWRTDGANFTADAIYKGLEMSINIAGASLPPSADPNSPNPAYISGQADVRGFTYITPTTRPNTQITIRQQDVANGYFTPNFTGIDFCEMNPKRTWFVGTEVSLDRPQVYQSSNGGIDNLVFKGVPVDVNTLPGKSGGGAKIAASATATDNAVVVVRNKVLYTVNDGVTWTPSTGIPTSETLLETDIEYEFDQLVKSDRVNGSKYYVVSPRGNFYVSTNGGQSFSQKPNAGLPARSFNSSTPPTSGGGGGIHLAVAPGLEEEVWVALGASGIWRATGPTGSKTDVFTKQTFFANENPTAVSFGVGRDAQSPPAVYVYGRKEGTQEWGIWKSDDLGTSWLRITPLNNGGQWCRLLVADRQVYGRVYMGDGAFGNRYYTYDTPPANPVLSASNSGTITCTVATLTLTATPTGQASYQFSAGATPTSTPNVATVSAPGVYSVVITGANGYTATANVEVFSDVVAPTVSLGVSNPIQCATPTATLSATGVGVSTYAFAGPDGFASGPGSRTALVRSPGTYTLTAVGVNGCFTTAIAAVEDLRAEIDVLGKDILIQDGDTTPATTDGTDFGATRAGFPMSQTFTVRNTGRGSLTLASITLSGPDAGDFSIAQAPTSVAEGAVAMVVVTFNGSTTGVRRATLLISSDACEEAIYDIALAAEIACSLPVFVTKPANLTQATGEGQCQAIATYLVTASGLPEPAMTYTFSGASTGSGAGSGSGATFGKGTTTVTLRLANSCGQAEHVFSVTVYDGQRPVITTDGNKTLASQANTCGAILTVNASASDNCSVGSPTGQRSDGKTLADPYPMGSTTITWTVTDADGNVAAPVTQTVTVTNAAPIASQIMAPIDPLSVGTPVQASVNFTDNNIQTATWYWGNGTTSDGIIREGSVSGTHTYATAGVYSLTVTLTDFCGATTSQTFHYVVVYDSSAGFVTGGGWINSPAGAYTPDPSLAGKASFGFVAKYQKGANIPSGNTDFQFQAGGLTFKSTVYDWLVIAGSKAQFKGSGTVNGIGDYSFMLTAIDGQSNGGGSADKFRIKISDKATSSVVYDNKMGQSDAYDLSDDTSLGLGGGSVSIHAGGKGARLGASPEVSDELVLRSYPNPIDDKTTLAFILPSGGNYRLDIRDVRGSLVRQLRTGRAEAGQINVVSWEVGELPAGLYLGQLSTDQAVKSIKLLVK